MGKKQRKAATLAYTTWLLELLNLREWEVTVGFSEKLKDDVHAHVETVYGRRCARIALPESFFELPPEEMRHVLIHELLHLHHEPVCWLPDTWRSNFTNREMKAFRRTLQVELEVMVDQMASAWGAELEKSGRGADLLAAIAAS